MKNEIKDKLEIFDEYVMSDQKEAPDSLRDRCDALQIKAPDGVRAPKNRRPTIRIALASAAAAVLVTAIALPVYFSGQGGNDSQTASPEGPTVPVDPPDGSGAHVTPPGGGNDTPEPGVNGVSDETPIDYAAFLAKYDVVAPSGYDSVNAAAIEQDTGVIYAHIVYFYGEDKLDMTVVFDDTYEIDGQSSFDHVTTPGKFGAVDYTYRVYATLNYGMAKFTYASNRYYISYYSRSPENITNVLATFTPK